MFIDNLPLSIINVLTRATLEANRLAHFFPHNPALTLTVNESIQDLRVTLEAMRSTPINKIENTADFEPLGLCIQYKTLSPKS